MSPRGLDQERNRFKSILDGMTDGVFIINDRCEIDYANRALERQFGPVAGRRCHEYLHGRKEECPWCTRRERFRDREVHREQMLARNQRTYDVIESPLQNEDGSVSRVIVLRDVTELKQAGEALEEALDLAQSVVDGVNEGLLVLDQELRVVSANSSFYRMFGIEPEAAVGMRFEHLGRGAWDRAALSRTLQELVGGPAEVVGSEVEREFEEGDRRVLRLSGQRLATRKEGAQLLLLALEDITERRRQERRREELMAEVAKLASVEAQESRLLHTIMENVGVQIAYLDRQFNFVRVNRAYAEGSGYEVEELMGKNHFELFPNEENQAIFEKVRETGQPVFFRDRPFEFPNQPERGTTYWDWTLTPVRDNAGGVQGLVLALRETTERRRAEEATWESQRRFQRLIESNVIGMLVADLEGGVLEANDTFLDIVGYDRQDLEEGRIDWYRITPEEYHRADEEALEQLMVSGSCEPFEKEYIHRDGRRVPVLLGAALWDNTTENPTWVSFVVDMTGQKEAEAKILAYERLAVLGQLAGGISHELRNPLATIDSSAYYVRNRLEKCMERGIDIDGKVESHLERIESSVDRCTSIIQSLVDLTQMKEPRRKRLDLGSVAREIGRDYQLPSTAKIDVRVPDEKLWVFGDRDQLELAFENLIKNGMEAMDWRGMLRLEVLGVDGGHAQICFTDSGKGIPREHLERIFQPLFSTKPKGIGFGLSIAKMVAERHGGEIKAQSRLGQGSTVTIRLPLA
ncbi:MAG: PAS domain S-box protein [Chloroflexota bacterium]